ncbi:hypothetical protein BYT27DRAFT_7200204 [Phlegmacium glaucopus]|nr:hypothetical protein BYT27DRAFT_7200204 [Phlegmacium glaucopus]
MLSHLSHYLHSNQPPSEDEAREIKGLRINPLKEISVVDAEIERIESILDSLKRKRANIQKSIDDCNTVLAPVRRLSMDILGVIFIDCIATYRNPIMDPSEAPILLTHICRDWRSIALSIPRLWSKMYIPLLEAVTQVRYDPLSFRDRMEARSEETQRWLRLSGACPLSIAIMPAEGLGPSFRPLLDAIIQSSRRWQQFELGPISSFSSSSDVYKRIFSLSADDLCMLREVRLHSPGSAKSIEDPNPNWLQSGILTAQGLRSISIANTSYMGAFDMGVPPNWKNLHHLFIHSHVTLGIARQMLSYCCNLVACLLLIDRDSGEVSITLSSSFLPHLKFLSLDGARDPSGCSKLFCNIDAPSLRILDCRGDHLIENERSGLLRFLQSINSLETLALDDHHLTGDNVLKCSTLTPSLSHLVLGQPSKEQSLRLFPFPYPHPKHVQLMTALYKIKHQHFPDSAPTVLFPALEVFEAYSISSITDEMLLEFIMARIDATRSNTAVSKLRKVLVDFTRIRQIDIVPEALAYARASGIELELGLTYYTDKEMVAAWLPSFGLSDEDKSWTYPLYDY